MITVLNWSGVNAHGTVPSGTVLRRTVPPTARLHYRTVLERLSENRYGSIENGSAPRLHCPRKTGPDGLVLINNH